MLKYTHTFSMKWMVSVSATCLKRLSFLHVIHDCIHTQMHAQIHMCMRVRAHTHTHTHTHTMYTHTHTLTQFHLNLCDACFLNGHIKE